MKGKETIKKGLMILFIVVQSLFLVFSILLIVLLITLYSKLRSYLMLSVKPLLISLSISSLYVLLPVIGILIIVRHRITYTFLYIVMVLLLMNFDILLVSMEYNMVKNTPGYTDKAWDKLSNEQREHVQTKLGCCGFRDRNDRSVGDCENVGCRDVFLGIVEGVKNKSERFLIGVFALKSLSLALVAMMSMRKKRNKHKNRRKTDKKSGGTSDRKVSVEPAKWFWEK
ncbi:Tetraspanin family integral membrane protein [Trachipleistophora hominis]|uniref:Tetraspanin family integral membrane protein n=1 Tax=Trachipleistophora hominis TaxID=72359 RepID=L7JTX3_TRAHO|nr:Tetraspanin family integral membrane protein [Trachipleistophora hominis]